MLAMDVVTFIVIGASHGRVVYWNVHSFNSPSIILIFQRQDIFPRYVAMLQISEHVDSYKKKKKKFGRDKWRWTTAFRTRTPFNHSVFLWHPYIYAYICIYMRTVTRFRVVSSLDLSSNMRCKCSLLVLLGAYILMRRCDNVGYLL